VDSQKVTFIVAAKKKALTKREVETFWTWLT
jgi:hypothetical protein